MNIKRFGAEVAGWYGAVAIVSAYALVSFTVIAPDSWQYQSLNLTGSVGILIISIVKRAYQPALLNVFWLLIASIAIINVVL